MTEHIDFIVHHRILLDIHILSWDVCFRLIIVVIGNKILDRIFRKEGTEFRTKLSGESFVMRKDKGGAIHTRYDIRHGEGFTRACDTEKCLRSLSCFQSTDKSFNGFGLVAHRLKITMKFECSFQFHDKSPPFCF